MSVDRVMASAPPMLEMNMSLTLEQGKARLSTHEVHTRAIDHTKPKPVVRFLGLGDDASAFTPHR